MTTCIPAAKADSTPFGASSNARHLLGSGEFGKRLRATSNASGAGLPLFTSGSDPHCQYGFS